MDNINEKNNTAMRYLSTLNLPNDVKKLTFEQCQDLCKEIRTTLIDTVSKNGGHLASNLGTVELTVALHRIFESPKDKFIWDVGHQCYTHKILTGRYNKFSSLRKENGISGFPKPKESEHDIFISGHSSTAISVANGVAEAMRLQGDEHHTIAIIGDGAMTGGLAYEGLNNAGKTNNNIIVILNDNTMSISKNVGSLAKYLSILRSTESYVKTKKAVEKKLNNTPVIGKHAVKILKSSKDALRDTMFHSITMFEYLGFIYLGPVDGHNIEELEEVLLAAKTYRRPVFIHIKTTKGKGYLPSEKNPGEFHGISKFNIETGNPEISGSDTYSDVFGKELVDMAQKDNSICAVTAAMEHGTGLHYFSRTFPDRYYDVGIAEQHAVTFAAALSSQGKLPVFAVYSSFLQRAYDQLLHDVSIPNIHLVIAIDRAGVVGEDGETHHGMFDVSFLTSIPNTKIYSPSCYDELKLCMKKAMYQDKELVCVRYPRGRENATFDKTNLNTDYTHISGNKTDTLVITYGRIYENLYNSYIKAKKNNMNYDILKLTCIFPLSNMIIEICKSYDNIIFFEESYYYGGISQILGDILIQNNYHGNYQRVAPKSFISQASIPAQLEHMGLSESKMFEKIEQNFKRRGQIKCV